MKKRLLTVLISFLLILASVPAFTFAQAAEGTVPFHYVALGDASATGYGMAGGAAYGKVTAGSYVAKIRDTLMSRHFDVTVDQLGMKGMRTEELRYLLDDSYTGDVYLSETFPEIRKEQQRFLDAIKGADLITYGLGSVNVGSFLIYTAFDPEGHCSDPAIKEIVKEDPDGIKSSIDTALHTEVAKISSAARSALAAMGYDIDEMIEQYGSTYIEGAAYVYYSFCKSYDESIRLIREQNPDAALVVLGLDNMLGEFSLSVKATGAVFEIGKLYEEELITKVNAHMAAAPGVSFIPTGNAERFLDEAASYNGDKNTISSQFKDYCDLYEDDLELKTAVNKKLASYNTVSKNRGLSVAYDTAAASLKDVAGIAKVDLSVNTLLYLKDLFAEIDGSIKEQISGMKEKCQNKGKELLAGLKTACLEYAEGTAKNPYYSYSKKLENFINNSLYGADANEEARKINRLIMFAGIRYWMGDGFFQMYSAKGHAALANAILNACADKAGHCAAKAATCTVGGNREFWQKVDGTCYTDEALTNQADRSSLVFKALGHQWGAWKVVRKAAFCKDGQEKRVCSKCGAFETKPIPGLGPANTKITKIVAGKKSFTVNWKKPSKKNLKKTTGYQIRYSLKSSMKGAKTVTVKKNKTVSLTVKKLKSKKKYFVQLRTYKTSGGKNYYSAWSASKTVKTK